MIRSKAAGQSLDKGRAARSRPCPGPVLPLPSCPPLLQRELLPAPSCLAAVPIPSHAQSVWPPGTPSPVPKASWLAAWPGCLLWPRGCLWSHPRQPRASVFLFRQTNKSRFGYHGRAVRRPTQTKAARLASPDALGSVQAVPGHFPRSRSGLATSPRLNDACPPAPSWRLYETGPVSARLQKKAGTLKSPGPGWGWSLLVLKPWDILLQKGLSSTS